MVMDVLPLDSIDNNIRKDFVQRCMYKGFSRYVSRLLMKVVP